MRACARAQVRKLLDDGVNVGLGVDGSASNDSGNLLHEARLACFLQRAQGDVAGAQRVSVCLPVCPSDCLLRAKGVVASAKRVSVCLPVRPSARQSDCLQEARFACLSHGV
jgi:Amidohydrolase family